MQINPEILIKLGAVSEKIKKGGFIFQENEVPKFYYQLLIGKVKVFLANLEGKELTQSEFNGGSSFGESLLFISENYPSTAVACQDSIILKLSKRKFFEFLDQNPTFQKKLIILLSRRIYDKTITTREIINNTPEARILSFLNNYKKRKNSEYGKIEIPYTRQEIANYTGLRVETVIRTLTKMKTKQTVQIIERKLIY